MSQINSSLLPEMQHWREYIVVSKGLRLLMAVSLHRNLLGLFQALHYETCTRFPWQMAPSIQGNVTCGASEKGSRAIRGCHQRCLAGNSETLALGPFAVGSVLLG